MSPTYTLFVGRDAQYYFTLYAENSEPILQSEGYRTKAGALQGIAAVRVYSPFLKQYRLHESLARYWFTLVAGQGEPLGRSEMYTSSAARANGVAAVQRCGPMATVRDLTNRAA